MRLPIAALVLANLLAGCATAPSRSVDLRPAWTCAVRSSDDHIDLTVIRTLDAEGRQLDAETQWSIGGFDGGRLSLMGAQRIKGAGDPPLRPREILVSWSGFPDRLLRIRLLVVLHAAGDPPNVLDGVMMIPYVNGLIGAVFSWQRVRALSDGPSLAQLSLIDPRGHAIRTAPLDLIRLDSIPARSLAALDAGRKKAARFDKSCEPVTEWMRL